MQRKVWKQKKAWGLTKTERKLRARQKAKQDKVKVLKEPNLDKRHQHLRSMLEMQILRPHTRPTESENGTGGGGGHNTTDRQPR